MSSTPKREEILERMRQKYIAKRLAEGKAYSPRGTLSQSRRLREEARERGQLTYHTERPCRNGHSAPRSTATGQCLICVRVQRIRSEEKRRKCADATRTEQREQAYQRREQRIAARAEQEAREQEQRRRFADATQAAQLAKLERQLTAIQTRRPRGRPRKQ